MKSFTEFSIESANVPDNANAELINGIKESFNKHFPNGWISVRNRKGLGDLYVDLVFGLIGDKTQLTSQYLDNDPMIQSFMIYGDENQYRVERLRGGISLKPEEGSYMAMGRAKIPYRKYRGNTKKVLVSLDKYMTKLSDYIKQNGDNVYQREKYSNKFFDL